MKMEEFLQPEEENIVEEKIETVEETPGEDIELDVQKAVVESLAAEKIECDERISSLEKENEALKKAYEELNAANALLKEKLSACETELGKVGEILSVNSETEGSNKIALLDRNVDLPDRFIGETREQVLEVIKEARDHAEASGRIRKAQVLEAVLVVNESTGELAKKRAALEKFFTDNGNIISGPVLAELERCGISHKKGEEYLLPSEIILRTY
jgi:hypothetical protein